MDFDFNKIGKELPYKVDEDYFERLPRRILTAAKRDQQIGRRHRLIYISSTIAAAMAALFITLNFLKSDVKLERPDSQTNICKSAESDNLKVDGNTGIDEFLDKINDDELNLLISTFGNDMF